MTGWQTSRSLRGSCAAPSSPLPARKGVAYQRLVYDVVLALSCIVFAAVSLAYLRHPAASLYHPASFYLAFHGFIFVIRPLFARWYGFDFIYRLYEFQPSVADKITVILAANLAMVVFVALTVWLAATPVRPIANRETDRARRALFWPIVSTAALLTPLALYSQFANWERRMNNFDTMLRDAATGNTINLEGNGWFTDAALVMGPLAVLLVWLARYRWWGWLYFAAFAFLQAGTGTRQALIFTVAAIAVTFLLERGRRWFDWRYAVLAFAALVAFNQIVIDRGGAVRALIAEDADAAFVDDQPLDPLEHMDFGNMEYFEYIVYAVPQRTGTYDYFAHMLQIATEPIPRALWPGKPAGSPVQRFSLWDYGKPIGMTASMPGMGWMSLGYPGVAIQAALFALLFAFAYRALLIRRQGALARLAYALAIGISLIGFRDGTLLTLIRLVPFYFGPLLLVAGLARIIGGSRDHQRGHDPLADDGMTPAQRRRAFAARHP